MEAEPEKPVEQAVEQPPQEAVQEPAKAGKSKKKTKAKQEPEPQPKEPEILLSEASNSPKRSYDVSPGSFVYFYYLSQAIDERLQNWNGKKLPTQDTEVMDFLTERIIKLIETKPFGVATSKEIQRDLDEIFVEHKWVCLQLNMVQQLLTNDKYFKFKK